MHKRVAVVVLAIAALGAPLPAAAGLMVGARAGWAFPIGEVRNGLDLDSVVRGQIPLQVDLGWRFADQFTLGGYVRLAPGVVANNIEDACDASRVDCDGPFGFAAGGQFELTLAPGRAGPWLGAFGGFESLNFDDVPRRVGETGRIDFKYRGWEAGVQGGIDFAWGVLAIGPFASASIGRYTATEQDISGEDVTRDVIDEANHYWIQVGLRGALAF
jgi:hypothetical protein